jgi:hypothetical protein
MLVIFPLKYRFNLVQVMCLLIYVFIIQNSDLIIPN